MLYQTGETARLVASITNVSGSPADPTTVKISIQDPDSDLTIDSVDMVKEETGSYHYDYEIPMVAGVYRYKVVAIGSEGRITIVNDSFIAENAI